MHANVALTFKSKTISFSLLYHFFCNFGYFFFFQFHWNLNAIVRGHNLPTFKQRWDEVLLLFAMHSSLFSYSLFPKPKWRSHAKNSQCSREKGKGKYSPEERGGEKGGKCMVYTDKVTNRIGD